MYITHIGTACVLLEVGGVRLLTDPVFDPKGGHYHFGFGMRSDKTLAPACMPEAVGAVDAVLLTHDQHEDNLDVAGRKVLEAAPRVVTTRAAGKRLGGALGARCTPLAPWESIEIAGAGGRVRVTATPARHGPPLSLPFVGEVVGFLIAAEGQTRGAVYMTGDTVWFAGVAEVARREKVGTLLLHLGRAAYGPLRFTMDAREGVTAARAFGDAAVIPIHYDGWSHFHEPRIDAARTLAAAGLDDRVRWLVPGARTHVED